MSHRTDLPGPEALSTVPLRELVAALENHLGDLERDRAGTGALRRPARVQSSALSALTIITAMLGRLTASVWPAVRDAVEHGAQLVDVAAALGEDDVQVLADRFAGALASGREPTPRDAEDVHPLTRGSVTGSVTAPGRIELVLAEQGGPWDGGSVVYRVLVDGAQVGLVGDGRAWRGSRWGARRWWACWRLEGDDAARWRSELDFIARAAAVVALVEQAGCVTGSVTAAGGQR